MKQVIILVLGVLFVLSFLSAVSAEKLDIQIKDSYIPGQDINFKLILYNDENNKIGGKISYVIQNYYSEIVEQGVADSGNEIIFNLPENAIQGPWKIQFHSKKQVSYNNEIFW